MKLVFGLLFIGLLGACASKKHSASYEIKENVRPLAWKVEKRFDMPESTYYDSKRNLIFVSNIGGSPAGKDKRGWISLMSTSGKVLKDKWVTGLNAPKGMISSGDTLWVSDIDRVVSININTGMIETIVSIPGSVFLNDLAIDDEGRVYVSDMLTGKIHRIESGEHEVFIEGGSYENPNGLFFYRDHLYIAAWGPDVNAKDFSTSAPGRFYKIHVNSKKITYLTRPLGNLDGLERTKDGDFIISDWVTGSVFRVNPENGMTELIYQSEKGTADIGYVRKKNLVVVPEMLNGSVRALSL